MYIQTIICATLPVHSVIQEYEIFENSKFTNKPKITYINLQIGTCYSQYQVCVYKKIYKRTYWLVQM